MTYTREEFGKGLKQRVSNKEAMESIAHWALTIYMHHCLKSIIRFQIIY